MYFSVLLLCDVWQFSHILSPGGGQRAEQDHAFFFFFFELGLSHSLSACRGEDKEVGK